MRGSDIKALKSLVENATRHELDIMLVEARFSINVLKKAIKKRNKKGRQDIRNMDNNT